MIWTMTQMRNQWPHLGVILEELERSIIGTKGKMNNEVEYLQCVMKGEFFLSKLNDEVEYLQYVMKGEFFP